MKQEQDWSKYGPEMRAALERLRTNQLEGGFTMKAETQRIRSIVHGMKTMRMMISRTSRESIR